MRSTSFNSRPIGLVVNPMKTVVSVYSEHVFVSTVLPFLAKPNYTPPRVLVKPNLAKVSELANRRFFASFLTFLHELALRAAQRQSGLPPLDIPPGIGYNGADGD
jgi:hypothetical protein